LKENLQSEDEERSKLAAFEMILKIVLRYKSLELNGSGLLNDEREFFFVKIFPILL
jgi:hypothetical protein